jgi:hypothetical protein
MTIELGRTYRDGYNRPVRIIATDAKRSFTPIIGLVTTDDGTELMEAYRETGEVYPMSNSRRNLIIPRRYIDLENAKSLIRARQDDFAMAHLNIILEDLSTMPFEEL